MLKEFLITHDPQPASRADMASEACHDCMPQFYQHAIEVKTMIKPEAVFRKMPW